MPSWLPPTASVLATRSGYSAISVPGRLGTLQPMEMFPGSTRSPEADYSGFRAPTNHRQLGTRAGYNNAYQGTGQLFGTTPAKAQVNYSGRRESPRPYRSSKTVACYVILLC